jgi:hypothetical protein
MAVTTTWRAPLGRRRSALQHRLLCLGAVLLCIAVFAAQHTRATLIASSKISYCTDAGDEVLNCTKKMVVTLTVEAGQQAGEESLVFLNSAVDGTASAKNGSTTTTTTASTTVSFSPITITTSRSAVRYRYPIFYVQNYNAKPYEATVKGKLLNQCNDDFNPDRATCGVAYDSNGKAIPFSQGFCCDCSMCQTLGFCEPDARANKACNIFDEYTTASCLRFGQRWYSGYTIGTYVTWFTLNVTVARNTTAGSGNAAPGVAQTVVQQRVVLQLSPTVLGDTAGDGWGASARLVGSFAPTDQPLDLTGHMLFAPALPLTDERVLAGAAEWMLLPNTLVTLDGSACNKIGVSYEAFASQGNKCNLQPGSCLRSQLEDYRTDDLARVAAGKKPQYMAIGYGNFDLERVANATNFTTGKVSPYISYIAASPAATMVVLTVSADDLQYIVGVAKGKILSASLNKAELEASTTDGVLSAVVQNVAAVTGRLVVSVMNCTPGVFPMAAQTLSLASEQQAAVTFNVYMQNTSASGTANCTVVVRNTEEVVTDARMVSWTVTTTSFNNGTQGGTAGSSGNGASEESSAVTCGTCGTLNIVCDVRRRCWGLILLDLVVYLVIVVVVFCVIWFRRFFCCCFYQRHSHGHHHHNRRSCSSRSSSSGNYGRYRHSPTRDNESRNGYYEESRHSRSRKLSSTASSHGLPQQRRRHRGGSPCCDHLGETVAQPTPPPMAYAIAPVHSSPAVLRGNAVHTASSSPFSSPLRVQPPPWLSLLPPRPPPPPPSPPRAALTSAARGQTPQTYCDVDTSSRQLSSPRAFSPLFPDNCAALSAATSLPSSSPASLRVGQERLAFPSSAALSPLTPSFSARGARSDYGLAPEDAPPWRAEGAAVMRNSRLSSPSPSLVRGTHVPYS